MNLFADILPQSTAIKRIAELGCGWGGMTIAPAKQYPDAIIDGYKISPLPYLVTKLRALPYRGRIKIYAKDFLKINLTVYQGMFCYLIPVIMTDLSPLLKQCSAGTIIISTEFPLPN